MSTRVASALAAPFTVSVATPALADDVSLAYDADRFPSTALSMNAHIALTRCPYADARWPDAVAILEKEIP